MATAPFLISALLLAQVAFEAQPARHGTEPAAAQSGTSERDAAGDGEPGAEPDGIPSILFLVDEADSSSPALLDAIRTELNDLDVDVRSAPIPEAGPLRERIAQASRAAQAEGSLGVFWLDGDADRGLMLQLVDPEGARMLARSVDAPSPDTAHETIAVIARGLTTALLEGRSIGMTPIEPREAPVTVEPPAANPEPVDEPAPEPKRERGLFRLNAGYIGTNYARETTWQNGVEVDIGWRFRIGIYAGVGYAQLQDIRGLDSISSSGDDPNSSQDDQTVVIESISRHPIQVILGYQHRWPRFAIDGEARLIVDPITTQERSRELEPTRRDTDLGVGLRLRLDYVPIPQLALFLGGGIDISLLASAYEVTFLDPDTGNQRDGDTHRYLSPTPIRPVLLAGFAVSL